VPDSLLSLVDELTAQLLSVEAGEPADRLEVLTTTSLPALYAYFEGRALYNRGQYRQAALSFLSAVQQDSTFALAAVRLGYVGSMVPGGVEGIAGLPGRIVRANRARLGRRDRIYSLAQFPDATDQRGIIERWEAAIPELQDSPEAWHRWGDVLFHFGESEGIENPLGRAKNAFEKALALEPDYFDALYHLVWIADIEGDTSFVRSAVTRYLERESTGLVAEEFRLRLALLNRDSTAVRDFDANLDSMSDDFLEGLSAAPRFARHERILWSPGRAKAATAVLLDRASTSTERSQALFRQYWLALNLGRPREADSILEVANSFLAPGQEWQREIPRIAVAVYMDGDQAAAEKAARQLAAQPALNSENLHDLTTWRLEQGRLEGVREVIERLRRGKVPAAPGQSAFQDSLRADILEARLARLENDPRLPQIALALDPKLRRALGGQHLFGQGNLTIARIYESLGDYPNALAAVRRQYRGNAPGQDRFGPTFLREEGRLAAIMGLREEAIAAYSTYLAVRADPEPAVQPQVDSVKAALAALRAGASP
jgi:tetratricopeptide (TPR) repeat protein